MLPISLVLVVFVVYVLLIIVVSLLWYTSRQKNKLYSKQLAAAEKTTKDLYERNRALDATYELFEIIHEATNFKATTQQIANLIPQVLGYETGVLALVNDKKNVLERVAISETKGGAAALKTLEIPFTDINIPLSAKENVTIQAINENEMKTTTDLYDIVRPTLSEKNAAHVQKAMGTNYSIVHPLSARGKVVGVLIVSMSKTKHQLSSYEMEMITRFASGVGIAIDNSRLLESVKKNTSQLKRANKRLQGLDKLKDEFVYVASHELRTPMTAIKSYLWLVLNKEHANLSEKLRNHIIRAYISTERLIKLVSDLLTVSRIEGNRLILSLEETDATGLALEVKDILQINASKKAIGLSLEEPDAVLKTYCDRTRISEVLHNMVGNAIKFTPDEGSITIRVKREKDMVRTEVTDTGPGISKAEIDRLFTKFGRLAHSYTRVAEAGGTGLGLYISKQIIEAHGGDIGVDSVDGEGATFWFTLPLLGSKKETAITKKIQSLAIAAESNLQKARKAHGKG